MDKKVVRSWMMYDWANSAFATTIMAAVLPIYFTGTVAKSLGHTVANSYLAYADAIALFFVFLLSPALGAIADLSGSKKKFLNFFTFLGIIVSVLMYTINPGQWLWALILVAVGAIAFSGATTFYDAFITDIAPEDKRDMVSSKGYAVGYIGGGVLLAINLAMIQYPEIFHLTKLLATKLSFFSVGVWWFIFSIPLFRNVHDKKVDKPSNLGFLGMTAHGFKTVGKTMGQLGKFPELLKFLIAFLLFNDGINTIILMATSYGTAIGMGQFDLIMALLITQFIGIPCTILFGKVAEKIGAMRTVIITLFIYVIIVTLGYFMTQAWQFYALAILVGMVQGGSQALCRSLFSRLTPVHKNAEFFGFFGLSGKLSAIFGPLVFGLVGQLLDSPRYGILSLIAFFVFGIAILFTVNLDKGKAEARAAEERELNATA